MRPSFSDDKTHFIGVLLPLELERKAGEKRLWARKSYGCRSGHSTMPHITLVPPFSSIRTTEEIVDEVKGIVAGDKAFVSSVDGYGTFGDRTLYMHVPQSEDWTILSDHISRGLKAMGEDVKISKKPFSPHITIANRDIPQGKIGEMLTLLSQDEVRESFSVEKIGVFHRKGWLWVLGEEDVVTLFR
ncbi:MAG: 2'-5' RNA ligase family protein [Candidatus Ornithospirochaeta sp.]